MNFLSTLSQKLKKVFLPEDSLSDYYEKLEGTLSIGKSPKKKEIEDFLKEQGFIQNPKIRNRFFFERGEVFLTAELLTDSTVKLSAKDSLYSPFFLLTPIKIKINNVEEDFNLIKVELFKLLDQYFQ